MAALTTEEEHVVVDFRDRVSDVLETEEQKHSSFLIRWLRARDHNIDLAEKMLKTSLAWRKENGIDQIVNAIIDPIYLETYPYHITGHDKYGHPIVVVLAGKWDYRRGVSELTTEEISYLSNYSFETVYCAIQNANKGRNPDLYPITQFTLIADWKGFSYWELCNLKVVQNMVREAAIFEAHYPEIGYRCLMINCPSFMNLFMMMMKPIIASKTYDKISVFGSDRKIWEAAFRDIMDDNQFCEILKLLS